MGVPPLETLIFVLVGLAIAALSVRERVWLHLRRAQDEEGEGAGAKPSPFSEAIVELVRTAGGVYLALVMAVNFLKLSVPARVGLLGVEFDPLAGLALLFTLLQPFFARFLVPIR